MPERLDIKRDDSLDPKLIGEDLGLAAKTAGASTVLAVGVLHGAGAAGGHEHYMEPGETVSEVAESWGTTTDVLAAQNELDDPDYVRVGQRLTYTPEGNGLAHVVQDGETKWDIENRYGLPHGTLGKEPLIHPGEIIPIPTIEEDFADNQDYIVKEGDTLEEIEENAGLPKGTLTPPSGNRNKIKPGDRIHLPDGTSVKVEAEKDDQESQPRKQTPQQLPPETTGEMNAGGAIDVVGTYTVEQFMAAIAGNESGASEDGSGDPNAQNDRTKAFGYFQIMPDNWPAWSQEAFGEVREQTPNNQIHVARFKMLQYYEAFGHNWSAVAVAWFAGPGRAQRYIDGDYSVLEMDDGLSSVRNYINKMAANIGKIDPKVALPEFNNIPPVVTPGVNEPKKPTTTSEDDKPEDDKNKPEGREDKENKDDKEKEPENQVTAEQLAMARCQQLTEQYGRKVEYIGPAQGFEGGVEKTIQLCRIDGNENADVSLEIVENVVKLLIEAEADGHYLTIVSAFRLQEEQIELRKAHCGPSQYEIYVMPSDECSPPTARPGNSYHQTATAIDFRQLIRQADGSFVSAPITRGSAVDQWMLANSQKYGLLNLPSEPWHYSTTGR